MAEVVKKKLDLQLVHLIIVAIIIIGFGYVPTFSTVTPFGMQAIGCFLGIIYGWIFIGMGWTTLVVLIFVPLTGIITADALISAGFGNPITLRIGFVIMLFSVMTETQITVKISNV